MSPLPPAQAWLRATARPATPLGWYSAVRVRTIGGRARGDEAHGQHGLLVWAPSTLALLDAAADGRRVTEAYFGLIGGDGIWPVCLTDYAHQRLRGSGAALWGDFLGQLDSRLAALAWARPTPWVLCGGALSGAWRRSAAGLAATVERSLASLLRLPPPLERCAAACLAPVDVPGEGDQGLRSVVRLGVTAPGAPPPPLGGRFLLSAPPECGGDWRGDLVLGREPRSPAMAECPRWCRA